MSHQDLHYLKLVTELIDSGLWARLSPGARTLYPVLLRFSDRNYKPVWPGTQRLLELTGFKQKASLRAARQELEEVGLITCKPGSGRSNSYYTFRFDWATPRGAAKEPSEGKVSSPLGGAESNLCRAAEPPPYNQIHISINNQPSGPPVPARPDLAQTNTALSWHEVEAWFAPRLSAPSLDLLRTAFRKEEGGVLFFGDTLPEYLKALLCQVTEPFFEPDEEQALLTSRSSFWRNAEE